MPEPYGIASSSREPFVDLWSSMKIVLRRWYVVLAGFLVTGLLAVAALSAIGPTYVAEGSLLLLLPPVDEPPEAARNPFLRFGPAGLAPMAEVVVARMMDEATIDRMVAAGASDDYVVERDPLSTAPILTVEAEAGDPTAALATVRIVAAGAKAELAKLQASVGAAPGTRIYAQDIIAPDRAALNRGNKVRALIGIVAVGVGATFYLTFLIEGAARSRRRSEPVPEPTSTPIGTRGRPQRASDEAVSDPAALSVGSGTDSRSSVPWWLVTNAADEEGPSDYLVPGGESPTTQPGQMRSAVPLPGLKDR